jgi:hypothetical protein
VLLLLAMSFRVTSPRWLQGLGVVPWPVLVVALAAAAGCGGADDRPASWSLISASIMEPSCATANCHSKITERAGVRLYDKIVGRQDLLSRHFVVPMDKDRSSVLHLMHAEGARRMPPDSPLPEIDILLVEKWITAGALDN